MTNKIILFILFLLNPSIIINQTHRMVDDNSIKEIEIEYVEIEIETPINVSCSNYETYFGDQIKVKRILDRRHINKLCRALNEFISSAKRYPDPPDVRIKIIEIYNNNKKEVFCVGRLISSFRNVNYINNNFISHILRDLKKE